MATRVAPYLRVKGAANAIEFYTTIFGAVELYRLTESGSNRVGHAEIRIGESIVMLSDEFPEFNCLGPQGGGTVAVTMQMEVDDVDAVVARALAAGARELSPVKDEFYGDRAGKIADPFGHEWLISTQKEKVAPEEMQRRYDELMKSVANS